jgi:hypothetical protein
MFINSNLFSKGIPGSVQPDLSSVLDMHRRHILEEIRNISDLNQMTDLFLEQLVEKSLVEPLCLQFDGMTRKTRTEGLSRRNSMAGRMLLDGRFDDEDDEFLGEGGNTKQVARLSIPFTGDAALLEYAPNPCGTTFPQGEISGKTVQFDVILWGNPDDTQRVKNEIQQNCEQISACAANINKQVMAFNESLPAQVKGAFAAKLDELTKQHAIFDDLGIAEEPEPPVSLGSPATPQPKKGKARAIQIIQNIETMYVQQLNQTNNNLGDVSNAIQSD